MVQSENSTGVERFLHIHGHQEEQLRNSRERFKAHAPPRGDSALQLEPGRRCEVLNEKRKASRKSPTFRMHQLKGLQEKGEETQKVPLAPKLFHRERGPK